MNISSKTTRLPYGLGKFSVAATVTDVLTINNVDLNMNVQIHYRYDHNELLYPDNLNVKSLTSYLSGSDPIFFEICSDSDLTPDAVDAINSKFETSFSGDELIRIYEATNDIVLDALSKIMKGYFEEDARYSYGLYQKQQIPIVKLDFDSFLKEYCNPNKGLDY